MSVAQGNEENALANLRRALPFGAGELESMLRADATLGQLDLDSIFVAQPASREE